MRFTKAQSTIIASIITLFAALIGGYFALQAATQPVLLQIRATQTAEAKVAVQTAAAGILQDLAGRGLISTINGAVVWKNQESMLEILRPNNMNYGNGAPVDLTNFVVTSEVSWDSPNDDGPGCGFFFGDLDHGSYYTASAGKNKDIQLWLMLNGEWKTPLDDPLARGTGTWEKTNHVFNLFVMAKDGNRISFLGNGNLVFTAFDDALNAGRVGFVGTTDTHSDTRCTFKNTTVWSLSP